MANEYLKVNGKLVMINNQLVKMPNETEYSDAVDEQSISLASTEELVSDILTKLTGYIDGSPKQVFDTLNTLKATYPNGASGTYLCKDNKHFYIYNGMWVDCGEYIANPFNVTLQNGTVISSNADFAEVGKGTIPVGYFVTANNYDTTNNVPIVIKANTTSDIRGVTVANPAFCAGIKSSMLNNGVLSSAYCYVGFAGVVNVIDNGKCTVNGVLAKRCMSDSDGTATPSSNNMGYQIISRVDANTIKIIVEPSADMIQRIKTGMSELKDAVSNVMYTMDQFYYTKKQIDSKFKMMNEPYYVYLNGYLREGLYISFEEIDYARIAFVEGQAVFIESTEDGVTKYYRCEGLTNSDSDNVGMIFVDIQTNRKYTLEVCFEDESVTVVPIESEIDKLFPIIDAYGNNIEDLQRKTRYVESYTEDSQLHLGRGVEIVEIGLNGQLSVDDGVPNVQMVENDFNYDNTNEIVNKKYVKYKLSSFATEHEARSLRKEILNLKEEIYGTILDVTTVEIEDNDIIPSVVEVGGSAYNVLPKGDVSVLEVYGDSVASENLLPISKLANQTLNGVTFTNNGDGTYTLNGTATGGVAYFHILPNFEIQKGTYYITDFFGQTLTTIGVYADLSANGYPCNRAFTTTTTTTTQITIKVAQDYTCNNVTLKPMLVRGSTAPTEFKPYFSGIKSVEYERVDVLSPNLLEVKEISGNHYGTIVHIDNQGWLYIDGYTDETQTRYLTLEHIPKVLPKGTYTFTMFIDGVTLAEKTEVTGMISINNTYFYVASDTAITTTTTTTTGIKMTRTATFDTDFSCGRIWLRTIVAYPKFTRITLMINKGTSVPTEYIPYGTTSILQTHATLNGLEGYRDTLEVRLNPTTQLYDVYNIKRTNKFIINADNYDSVIEFGRANNANVWQLTSGTNFLPDLNNNNNMDNVLVISNYHTLSANALWTTDAENAITVDANKVIIINTKLVDTDVITEEIKARYKAEFKQQVIKKPIEIIYALETPTEDSIQSNLDFEQVTAMGYVSSPIDIVDANNVYGTKPKTKLGIVYKNTAVAR